jgi:hypothetical protein
MKRFGLTSLFASYLSLSFRLLCRGNEEEVMVNEFVEKEERTFRILVVMKS